MIAIYFTSFLVIHNLSDSGQKMIERTQDAGLELLEDYAKRVFPNSSQRRSKLLLFLGQVKALSKDITKLVEDKQVVGSKSDDIFLKLISQCL